MSVMTKIRTDMMTEISCSLPRLGGSAPVAVFFFTLSLLIPHASLPLGEATHEEAVWLEAELFPEKGGWVVDSQFLETVGSSYLLAAGLGPPVGEAWTAFSVVRPGTYAVWIRSKNWRPRFSPGRFAVRVDKEDLPQTCGGRAAAGWGWEKAGERALGEGIHTLALRDLTGAYGRCDAVFITPEKDFIPPAGGAELDALRRRYFPPAAPSPSPRSYDVVVIGGGVGGVCAALAAAREGCSVALIQNRPVLGGNASTEIGVAPQGAEALGRNRYARETGLMEELWRSFVRRGTWDAALLEAVKEADGIDLYLNRQASAPLKEGNKIVSLEARDVTTAARQRIAGKIFVDCSGDGDLAVAAGAEYREGREARSEFNESLAPNIADRRVMGASLRFETDPSPSPVPFLRPPWAHSFPFCADLPHREHEDLRQGFWWISYAGDLDPITQGEEIRDELLRVVYGVWDHLRNRCPAMKEECAKLKLSKVQVVLGKRESRRLMGDYILTQWDVQSAPRFPDRVAYGGWPIDLHPPRGIFDPGLATEQTFVRPYAIPFRSLYSHDLDNLLFAGRHISATHVALGSARTIGTIASCAQAVGTAAALCVKHGITPRQLGSNRIEELQQELLKNDARIPDLPNRDPGDLARSATVAASSYAANLAYTRERCLPSGLSHPLNYPRAMLFLATGDILKRASLLLRSENQAPVRVEIGLRPSPGWGKFEVDRLRLPASSSPDRIDLATASAEVPPGGPRWADFPLTAWLEPGAFYWIWVSAAPGVSWEIAREGAPWSVRGVRPITWETAGAFRGLYGFVLEPPLLYRGTEPANAINGLAWPENGSGNLWVSDPAQPLPQWIELSFPAPKSFNAVYLTFDTDLDQVPKYGEARSPYCAKRYAIKVPEGKGWRTIAEAKDNWLRFRVHRFPAVTAARVRVEVLETNGDPSARIYEVRVYDEEQKRETASLETPRTGAPD